MSVCDPWSFSTTMFPSLLEEIGWSSGADSIPAGSIISLGDSAPLDTLPFLLTFMNFWLKTPGSTVIFVSFKTAHARLSAVMRKLFGYQLPMLSAQGRFLFIDAISKEIDVLCDEIKRSVKPHSRTIIILESFSLLTDLRSCIQIHSFISDLSADSGANSVFQWHRSLESDYPGRSEVIREDIELGGRGWLYLLNRSHFSFCARPLRSGATKDAAGEIVAAFGPKSQDLPSCIFHPITALYRMPTDTSIQLVRSFK